MGPIAGRGFDSRHLHFCEVSRHRSGVSTLFCVGVCRVMLPVLWLECRGSVHLSVRLLLLSSGIFGDFVVVDGGVLVGEGAVDFGG